MTVEYGVLFSSSLKNIKNRHNEKRTLDMILNHMKICSDFKELSTNGISLMFGFERLKHELCNYYSFNLNKNGGKSRLIFSISNNQTVKLEYISVEHYGDFKKKIRK